MTRWTQGGTDEQRQLRCQRLLAWATEMTLWDATGLIEKNS